MSTIDAYLGGLNALGKNYVDASEGATPDIDNAKEVIGDVKTIRVVRKVLCLKSDAVDVSQDLIDTADPLTMYVGKDSPIEYGSGYRLTDMNSDHLSASMMSIAASYEKELQGVFDWQLPPSVTVTCANGDVTISFDGTPVETYETDKACKEQPLRLTGTLWTKTLYRVTLFANDVEVEHWDLDVSGTLDPENNDDHYLHWEYSGTDYARLVLLGVTLIEYQS